MTIERREELISAYVDGELEPAERAEVEKWLAESLEARQLRDELVALGGSVRSLPRHKLDRDLGSNVLQRAERSVLGGAAGLGAPDVRPRLPIAEWWSRGAGWRRLAWPAVAVAAALLLMIFNSDERPVERQIAQAPKGETSITARESAPGAGKLSEAVAANAQPSDKPEPDKPASVTRRLAKKERADDQPQSMLKRSADSEPFAAPAAAAGSSYAADSYAPPRQTASGGQPGLPVIVCDVSPEYLKDKSFEKLLQKLKVEIVSDELSRSKSRGEAKKSKDRYEPETESLHAYGFAENGSQRTYTVEATPGQIAQIIAEMRSQPKQVEKLQEQSPKKDETSTVDEARDVAARYRFLLQVPAAPSAPAEGDDKP